MKLRFQTLALLALACCSLAAWAKPSAGVRSELFGTTAAGQAVHVYTLTNSNGMEAKILDYGATIHQLFAPDRQGKLANVVLSLDSLADYEKFSAVNSVVGRYANRIKNGFTLNGKHYDLPGNAAGINVHSGPNSYYKRVWNAEPLKPGVAALTLSLDSPDGDQGFPGHLRLRVTFRLTEASELRLEYAATTDQDTFINFTNHVYFNLSGDLTKSVLDQQFQLHAGSFTEPDSDNVPTGRLLPVASTALDFRAPHLVGGRFADKTAPDYSAVRNYDFNWVLDEKVRNGKTVAARMTDPASGRVLEVLTTEPGIQVFCAPGLPATVRAAGGVKAGRGAGLALETQHFPDSPNHPNFPSTLLKAGQSFRSVTIFRIGIQK